MPKKIHPGPSDMHEVEDSCPPRNINALIERYLRREIEALRTGIHKVGRAAMIARADAISQIRDDFENLREDGFTEIR